MNAEPKMETATKKGQLAGLAEKIGRVKERTGDRRSPQSAVIDDRTRDATGRTVGDGDLRVIRLGTKRRTK